MRFWTSDTHFGHENILRLGAGRSFRSIDHHDSALVDRWNEVVTEDDEVWHLGDFSMKPAVAFEIVPYLNGKVILVAGNHDACWTKGRTKTASAWDANTRAWGKAASAWEEFRLRYLEAGFHEVISSGTTTTTIAGRPVMVSHLPSYGDPYLAKFAGLTPEPGELPLVCGHVHGLWRTYGRQINVGVDHWGFAPVAENILAAAVRELPERYEANEYGA